MRAFVCGLLCLALLFSAVTAAAEPSAEQLAEARTRFHRGLELYDEGDLDAALVELTRAYELSPSYKLLFNIAQVRLQKADYVGALDTFERYLTEGGRQVKAARRRKVEAELAKLRSRVAEVTVTGRTDGAELLVDDVPEGTTPLSAPIRVNAGRRKLTLSKPGRAPITRYVEVAGAEQVSIELELPENAPIEPPSAAAPPRVVPSLPAAPVRSSTPPVRKAEAQTGVPWLAWAATGALGAAAIVTGALAFDASRDLEKSRNTLGASPDELDRESRKTRTLSLTADILAGASVVAGGVSLYLTLASGSREFPRETGLVPFRIGASARF